MTEDVPEFGDRTPGGDYRPRPSAYAVITDAAGRVGVCRLPKGHFLAGGGIDPGEDMLTALRREVREELGHESEVGEKIGVAAQYCEAPGEGHFRKIGHFFHVRLLEAVDAGESDHELVWLDRSVVLDALKDAFQRWAVQRGLGL